MSEQRCDTHMATWLFAVPHGIYANPVWHSAYSSSFSSSCRDPPSAALNEYANMHSVRMVSAGEVAFRFCELENAGCFA